MRSEGPVGPRPRIGPFHLLAIAGALPLLGLTVFAYFVSSTALQRLVHSGNDATATITGALVEREFEHWSATLTAIARFPTFSAAVASGDVEEARRRLMIFVDANPSVDRAFVTDTTGILWSDAPPASESLGRSFDDRDWYRGVREAGGPYVSEVYQRNAQPQLLVVAVAVPVPHPATGATAGFFVAQVRLGGVSELLRRVEVGEDGVLLLLDHTGALVAHPSMDLQERIYDEYADVPSRFNPSEGEIARGEYTDPFSAERMLVSALPIRVGDHIWTVVAQQPVAVAFAATRSLAWRLVVAGLLVGLLVGGFLWGLARANARSRRAEEALDAMNRDLERRVEEGTLELRKKEEELLQAQKMEAVGRLAGGVAHDFNNLLSVILGCVELQLAGVDEDASEREDLENIRAASMRAAELTRQLLAFSRKQVMKPQVFDVNEAVDRMRAILERSLGEDVELVCRLSPEPHPVRFDPGQIEQVVMNLAVNARDAMPRGGRLTIATGNVVLDEEYARDHRGARSGPHVVLSVSDTGAGMDAETRRRIFEPFFTTKTAGKGTGLGLSTVYGIVRQGGGNIWVYSEPGKGTTFKVYLPRSGEAPGPLKEAPEPYEADGSGLVLVVEDDGAVRSLVVRILEGAGYEVIEAADGKEARRAARNAYPPPDLLLSDLVLPDATGPELAAEFLEARPELRVVFMSGYAADSLDQDRAAVETAAFIEKPFHTRDLLEAIGRAMVGRAEAGE